MGGRELNDQQKQEGITVSELYHKAFPHYLAMGMTWEQFWEQDCSLVRDYREAKRIRFEEENYFAWLHGLYIYEALCNASPLFRAFSKSGTRAGPYPEKPHEFAQKKRLTPKQENEKKMQAGIAYMERMTARFNQNFFQKQKQEEDAKKAEAERKASEAVKPEQQNQEDKPKRKPRKGATKNVRNANPTTNNQG